MFLTLPRNDLQILLDVFSLSSKKKPTNLEAHLTLFNLIFLIELVVSFYYYIYFFLHTLHIIFIYFIFRIICYYIIML